MLTCGLKLTHDGAVALIDGDRLVFSVEAEKLANNARYSRIEDLDVVATILERFDYTVDDVDHFVVDGWGGSRPRAIDLKTGGKDTSVIVAPYHEDCVHDVLTPPVHATMMIANAERAYTSFSHVAGHIASTYYTSPFAACREGSFVLVWDGGMFPRLYYANPQSGAIENRGTLFPVMGHFYSTAGMWFGPWPRATSTDEVAGREIAGSLMAYISLGTAKDEVMSVLSRLWEEFFTGRSQRAVEYRRDVAGWGRRSDVSHLGAYFREVHRELDGRFSDEDVLASMHSFVQSKLVDSLRHRVAESIDGPRPNLCLAGGCALNIKWNSRLRDSGVFAGVWIPPFPSDAGSAIGAALCHVVRSGPVGEFGPLNWHVRLGPEVGNEGFPEPAGWSRQKCDVKQLAAVLHTESEPVVVLNGRAELGPRALGGRSILAAPRDAGMKDRLNAIKRRAAYRPVAPICLESEAPTVFAPGQPDPYMLFDHRVRAEWVERIPAVVHLDGTARLQTVNESDDPFITALLQEYSRLSGIPVLCNTSANHSGSGFFPDVQSAAEWGRVGLIWNNGFLYRKNDARSSVAADTCPAAKPN